MSKRTFGQGWAAPGVTILAVLCIGLICAAAVFSIARGTSDVADDSLQAIRAEAALSAAAATRNATTQSQVLAEAVELSVAEPEELQTGLTRTSDASAEFERRISQLTTELDDPAQAGHIASQAAALLDAAARVQAQIEADRLEESLATIEGELTTSYDALVRTLAETRNVAFAEIAIARDDAGRLADAARFVVVLVAPVAILIVYRSRIRSLHKRNRLKAELEKEQAVSRTKTDFISHISHELRTPLTSIYGSALALSDDDIGSNSTLAKELTSLITEESSELTRMVEDILTVAAAEQGQLTVEMEILDPIAEIAGILEPLELTGRRTTRSLRSGTILADRRYFRQLMSNIVSNAHRHGLKPVLIAGGVDGSDYVIEVIDHGPGVDTQVAERLFDPYMHGGDTPLVTGSVGLGLAVAETLASHMNAAIAYERRNNTTVFSVRLPTGAGHPSLQPPAGRAVPVKGTR